MVRWFQHHCDWGQEADIARFQAAAGLEGWGFLMRIFEIVGARYKPGKRPEATYPIKTWCALLGVHRNRFNKLLAMANTHGVLEVNLGCTGGVDVRFEGCSPQDTLTLFCPKLLPIKDEYSRKSGHSPETIPRKDEDEDIENRRRDQTNDLSDHLISGARRSPESPNIVGLQSWNVESFIQRITAATGDNSFQRNGTRADIGAILTAGLYEQLDAEVDHVEKDQDPQNAEARGRPFVEHPAGYMQAMILRLKKQGRGPERATRRYKA